MNELDLTTLTTRAEAEARLETWVHEWAMRKFLATNLEHKDEGRWRWTINLPVLTAALPALEANSLGTGDRFTGETLFIAGGKSAYVRAADRAGILGHFPVARIETISTAAHNPHIETRDAFVRLCLSDQP